ncbi:MAG: hypothetical protein EB009_04130 [Actinobacteria bacterium]|nr:hypothetical protein [Actinomycetota bacterium]
MFFRSKTRLAFPPVVPPLTVNKAVLLFLRVVVPELFANVIAPETVKADVVLFSVMLVTLEPIPPEIVVVPLPAPIFVTVPVLLIELVENVIVPEVALLLIVRLFVPVTPPEKVVEIIDPVLPMVNVPVVLLASTIG